MKSLAESIQLLAGKLHRLQRIKSLDELRQTIDQFVEYSRILVSKPSHVDEHSHRAL